MDLDIGALRGLTDLALAVEQEGRLLQAFRRAVLQQREAVVAGNAPALETSVHMASRALLTLQEARRHRAAVLQRLVGDPAQPLLEIDTKFETPLPEAFLAARSVMRRSATEAADDVWRTQQLLLAALRERDALLQELLTGSRPAPPEQPGAIAEGRQAGIDRQLDSNMGPAGALRGLGDEVRHQSE